VGNKKIAELFIST